MFDYLKLSTFFDAVAFSLDVAQVTCEDFAHQFRRWGW